MEKEEIPKEGISRKAKSRFASIKILLKNRLFLLFLLGDVIIGFAFEIIDYPLIVYMLSLGLDLPAIGQLTSAGLIAAVFSQIPAGILTDRVGRKNSIILGLCIYAVFPIFYPLSNAYIFLLVIAVLSGVANAILVIASFTFVGEVVPAESRSTAMAMTFFVGGILTFGPFVGTALYVISKALPFVMCSLLTVLTIGIFYAYIKPPINHKTTRYRERIKIADLAKTFKRSLIGISIANLAYSFGAGILFLLGFVYILSVFEQSILLAGLALTIPQVISFILSLFIGQWMDRSRKRKLFLIFGLLGYGVAAFTFTLVTNAIEAILVWIFLMVMGTIVGASSSTLVIETSEEATRGTSMSVYSLFGTVGAILSLQLSGYLQKAFDSFQKPFYFVTLLCVLAITIVFMIVREKPLCLVDSEVHA